MTPASESRRRRNRVAIDAAMMFIIVALVVQMWLLTATLESYLAGHQDAAQPGFLISLVLFAACFALYRLVVRLDRSPDRPDAPSSSGPWTLFE